MSARNNVILQSKLRVLEKREQWYLNRKHLCVAIWTTMPLSLN